LETRISSLRPKTSKFSFTKSKSTPSPSQPIKHDESQSQHDTGPSKHTETVTKDPSGDVIRFENLKQSVIRLDPHTSTPNSNMSSTVILKNLEMCIIDLRPSSSSASSSSSPSAFSSKEKNNSKARVTSLHGEGLRYCTLILPVDGSVLLHSLTSCILLMSCHQVSQHPHLDIIGTDSSVPNARFYSLFCTNPNILNADY
jgi:hypothetical protein